MHDYKAVSRHPQQTNQFPITVENSTDDTTKDASTKLKQMMGNFFRILFSPFVHVFYSTLRGLFAAKMTLKIFYRWWKEPEKWSHLNRKQSESKVLTGNSEDTIVERVECPCQVCKNNRDASEASILLPNSQNVARVFAERMATHVQARRAVASTSLRSSNAPVGVTDSPVDAKKVRSSSDLSHVGSVSSEPALNSSREVNDVVVSHPLPPAEIPLPASR